MSHWKRFLLKCQSWCYTGSLKLICKIIGKKCGIQRGDRETGSPVENWKKAYNNYQGGQKPQAVWLGLMHSESIM